MIAVIEHFKFDGISLKELKLGRVSKYIDVISTSREEREPFGHLLQGFKLGRSLNPAGIFLQCTARLEQH